MLLKKEFITSQKLGSRDFRRIANSVLNKGKSAIPPLFSRQKALPSASDKANLLAKNFSKNSNLDDSGIKTYLTNWLKLVSAIFYEIVIFSTNDSPLKTMKNVFLFHLNSSFCSQDIQIFVIFLFLSPLSRFKWTNGSGIIYVMNWLV